MVDFSFNAQGIPPSEPGLPQWDGLVPVKIMKTEQVATKSNDGQSMLVLTLQALAGPYTGQSNQVRLNLWNRNPKAVEIAQRELSSISHVTGRMTWTNSDQLIGADLVTRWETETRDVTDQTTGKVTPITSSNCKEYRALDGRTPQEILRGQPAANPYNPHAPQQAQQHMPAQQHAGPAPAPAQAGFQPGAQQPQQQPFAPPAAQGFGTPQPGGFAPQAGGVPQGAPVPSGGQPGQGQGTPTAGFPSSGGPGFGPGSPPTGFGAPPAGSPPGFAPPGAAPAPGQFTPPGQGFAPPGAPGGQPQSFAPPAGPAAYQPQPGAPGPWNGQG